MMSQQTKNGAQTSRQDLSVLISGASFAGLATAYWMDRLGYAVTIVEVAKDLRRGGTPVNIRDGVVDVVKRMGLLECIASHRLPPRPISFFDAQGNLTARIFDQPEDAQDTTHDFGSDGCDSGEYEIERDVLLEILFNEVKDSVEFLFEDSISDLVQSAEEVAVTFAIGARRSFSLVFGCDGTHSAVRRMCFGQESSFLLFMQNYFSLTIVNKLLIAENTQQMFNVPGKTIMLNAYNQKTDIAFCFFSEKEIAYDRRNLNQQKQMIREQFEGEGWRVHELLDEMSRCENFYFDKLCQIRMGSWSKGRVALVGDAAYCPSPTAGMGGSVAILGAAALADAFHKHPDDFRIALQEYDKGFRTTIEGIQADAIEFGLEMIMPQSSQTLVMPSAAL